MNPIIRAVMSSVLKDLFRTPKGILILLGALVGVILLVVGLWGTPSGSLPPSSTTVLQHKTESSLSKKDERGDEWSVELSTIQSEARLSGAHKEPGPPFLVCADVRQTSQWKDYSIGVSLLGQGGEAYSPCIFRNGKLAQEPRYTIVAKRGKVLGSGTFKYG